MSERTPEGGQFTNEDLFTLRTTAADTLKRIVTADVKELNEHHEGVKAQAMAALGVFQIQPEFDQQIELMHKLEERLTLAAAEIEATEATPRQESH